MSQSSELANAKSPELPKTFLDWMKVFGPGAIVASLTIGTGELIFSTRGGALFGYRILFLFVIISILKWGLVIATSRHMLLTGVHPYERMVNIPGPRGWLPIMLLIMTTFCMPIWMSFHSGVLGNLTSWLTGTSDYMGGALDYLWGGMIFAGLLVLAALGGYTVLEKIQIIIVFALVGCAGLTLVLYKPDWLQLLFGIVPQQLSYPDWLFEKEEYKPIWQNSVWVETTRYVGVIGGAGFDYMAYTSWLREKNWGMVGSRATKADLKKMASDPQHPARLWLRAPMVDSTISFALIIGFSAIFVVSGAMILGPKEVVPDENNLLNLQAEFVTNIHPLLLPLYVTGAFLTMLGTLYGTIEIACSIADEIVRSFKPYWNEQRARQLKKIVITWCAVVAFSILTILFFRQSQTPAKTTNNDGGKIETSKSTEDRAQGNDGSDKKDKETTVERAKPKERILLDLLLTPVNLFTGVLFCGIICVTSIWMDRKYLPPPLRSPMWLVGINIVSAIVFLALGLKGYWDHSLRWGAIGGIMAVMLVAMVIAATAGRNFIQTKADDS